MARPMRLLNRRQVEQIIKSDEKYIAIAANYGISESYVKMIKFRNRRANAKGRKKIELFEEAATKGIEIRAT